MMIVTTTAGRTLKLSFAHSSHDFETREGASEFRTELDLSAKVAGRRVTLAEVYEVGDTPEQNVLIGQGVSICHPNDTFKKAVGRKLSLTYALEAAALSREDRADVWKSYLDRFGR